MPGEHDSKFLRFKPPQHSVFVSLTRPRPNSPLMILNVHGYDRIFDKESIQKHLEMIEGEKISVQHELRFHLKDGSNESTFQQFQKNLDFWAQTVHHGEKERETVEHHLKKDRLNKINPKAETLLEQYRTLFLHHTWMREHLDRLDYNSSPDDLGHRLKDAVDLFQRKQTEPTRTLDIRKNEILHQILNSSPKEIRNKEKKGKIMEIAEEIIRKKKKPEEKFEEIPTDQFKKMKSQEGKFSFQMNMGPLSSEALKNARTLQDHVAAHLEKIGFIVREMDDFEITGREPVD